MIIEVKTKTVADIGGLQDADISIKIAILDEIIGTMNRTQIVEWFKVSEYPEALKEGAE